MNLFTNQVSPLTTRAPLNYFTMRQDFLKRQSPFRRSLQSSYTSPGWSDLPIGNTSNRSRARLIAPGVYDPKGIRSSFSEEGYSRPSIEGQATYFDGVDRGKMLPGNPWWITPGYERRA